MAYAADTGTHAPAGRGGLVLSVYFRITLQGGSPDRRCARRTRRVHDPLSLRLRNRRRRVHLFPVLTMPTVSPLTPTLTPPRGERKLSGAETRFVNAMRLSARQWLAVAAIVGVVLVG